MILEQITEVSNRSFSNHDFNEISMAVNIVSESKKPVLLKKEREKGTKPTKINQEELLEKISGQKTKKPISKEKPTKKKTKKKKIEETIEEIKDELEDLRIVYDQLASEYNTAGVDYESLFSYLSHKATNSDGYDSRTDLQGPMSLIISDEEAEETIQKIQISYLVGDTDGVSYQEKEKLSNWIIFNQALRSLYEVLSPIKNENVNYNKLN